MPDTQPVGSLVAKAKTIDQARCFKCVVGARATLPQAKAIATERTPRITGAFHGAMPTQTPAGWRIAIEKQPGLSDGMTSP